MLQQQILIGDLNQINTPEDVQKLSVKHEILGKNSNIFEAIVPRESLPNFKETDPDNSINNKNNDTTILDLKPNEKVEPKSEKIDLNIEQRPQGNLKKILSLIDPPKCSNKRGVYLILILFLIN